MRVRHELKYYDSGDFCVWLLCRGGAWAAARRDPEVWRGGVGVGVVLLPVVAIMITVCCYILLLSLSYLFIIDSISIGISIIIIIIIHSCFFIYLFTF